MARILITGASGFIGGFLVEQALEAGLEVTAAVRSSSDRSRLTDPRIQCLDVPLGSIDSMTDLFRAHTRFDYVVHNAGVTKALDRQGYIEGNTENTRRLVQALRDSGKVPDRFLFVSSLAALGPAPEGLARIRAYQPAAPLTTYGESKHLAEEYLSAQADFPWITVQPTAVYGPWERDILTFIRLMSKGLELTIGLQSQRLSFIHATDVARAIFRILEHPDALHQTYILSDGRDYNTEDLGHAVRASLGKEKTLKIKLPLGLIRPIAGIAEAIGRWQKKAVPLNREKIPELAAKNWHCDAEPLISDLGFQPRFDLYSGMQHSIQWYRERGWL